MSAIAYLPDHVQTRRPLHMHRCQHCGNMVMQSENAPIQLRALHRLAADLDGCSADCWRFFELLFPKQPRVQRICEFSRELGIQPPTLVARFVRAGLPSPKLYLIHAIFVHAAAMLEQPGRAGTTVAIELGTEPTRFTRSLKLYTGLRVSQLAAIGGDEMFARFRDEFVRPYATNLREFRPFTESKMRRRRMA